MSKPSRGVSIVKEYDKTIFIHLACDCMSPDCTKIFELSYEEDVRMIIMNIYVDLMVHTLYNDNWFIRQWNKVKGIFKILFNIPLTYSTDLCLVNEDHIQDFIDALEYARIKLAKVEDETNEHASIINERPSN